MLKGTNQEFVRPLNCRIVMETARRHGLFPRTEIARRVGLTIQTVSTITSELHERGLVVLRPGGRNARAKIGCDGPDLLTQGQEKEIQI